MMLNDCGSRPALYKAMSLAVLRNIESNDSWGVLYRQQLVRSYITVSVSSFVGRVLQERLPQPSGVERCHSYTCSRYTCARAVEMELDCSFYEVANCRHMFELETSLMMETVSRPQHVFSISWLFY